MISLQSDELTFAFPELLEQLRERVHAWVDKRLERATPEEKSLLPATREETYYAFATCLPRISAAISFQRTLRMPDNGKDYPLPLGLGRFAVYPVDDFRGIPAAWQQRGGVMLAMHPTEALWLSFYADYPMALRVGADGHCAISGEPWGRGLKSSPQNYVVLGSQPWLDGFHLNADVVQQFVAAPQGQGILGAHTFSGEEHWGGLLLQAIPLQAEDYWWHTLRRRVNNRWDELMTPIPNRIPPPMETGDLEDWVFQTRGKIRLKVLEDPYGMATWDPALSSRCFAHLCLVEDWERLTGIRAPQSAPTADDYKAAGVSPAEVDAMGRKAEYNLFAPEISFATTRILDAFRQEESNAPPLHPRTIFRLNPDLRQSVREF